MNAINKKGHKKTKIIVCHEIGLWLIQFYIPRFNGENYLAIMMYSAHLKHRLREII